MLHPFPHERHDGEPVIELSNVYAGYEKQHVLHGINLRIMPGDFIGLLGPSGSGKTTLLRTLLGATSVYSGEIYLHGKPAKGLRSHVGYVPQLETIDWNFPVTVEEVVMMGATRRNPLFPWHQGRDKKTAGEMMDRLGISHLVKRHIRELSGGQQQRVFLARALISNPEVLLLDEPTSGVDIKTRDEVMHLLHDLNHQGITVVLTTHEINAVAVHLPWLVCINQSVVAEGSPSEIITPENLKRTYGAEMPVLDFEGVPLVAESPHFHGVNGRKNGRDGEAAPAPGAAADMEKERV